MPLESLTFDGHYVGLWTTGGVCDLYRRLRSWEGANGAPPPIEQHPLPVDNRFVVPRLPGSRPGPSVVNIPTKSIAGSPTVPNRCRSIPPVVVSGNRPGCVPNEIGVDETWREIERIGKKPFALLGYRRL